MFVALGMFCLRAVGLFLEVSSTLAQGRLKSFQNFCTSYVPLGSFGCCFAGVRLQCWRRVGQGWAGLAG